MGLHCCELSQVEDGQKMPSHKSREGCVLVPHSNDCCSGDWCHGQHLVPCPGSGTLSSVS